MKGAPPGPPNEGRVAYTLLAGLLHLVVDMASIGLLYSEVWRSRLTDDSLTSLFLLYNCVAFALQPLLGMAADRAARYSRTAAAGLALAALAVLVVPWNPFIAASMMGLGNALFHVGAGAYVLRAGQGRATFPGLMVGPGAIGVWLGVRVGSTGDFQAITFLPLLLASGVIMLLVDRRQPLPPTLGRDSQSAPRGPLAAACVLALLGSVVVRSLAGGAFSMAWPGMLAVVLGAAGGKMLGGLVADRLGWRITAVGSLLALYPLRHEALADPVAGTVAMVLIQMSMAVTLTALFRAMPDRPGLAFGLPSLAILVGALPQYLEPLSPLLSVPLGAPIAGSAILMLVGLNGCAASAGASAGPRGGPPEGRPPSWTKEARAALSPRQAEERRPGGGERTMSITAQRVRELFDYLGSGLGARFFEHVADDVCWTVMGTHPLAGTYHGKKEVVERTFTPLAQVLSEGVVLKITHVLVHEDVAVVEMESRSTARNGMPYRNTYCWILTFEGDSITEVRAYVDSAAVQALFAENSKPA